jgi:hypothetical protein
MKKQNGSRPVRLQKITLCNLQQVQGGAVVVKAPTTTCTRNLPGSGCCCSQEFSGCAAQPTMNDM